MAAAYCNNVAAAEVLWECGKPEQLLARNLQGKTPYHIASEMGHLEMIQFLKPLYETHVGGNMPLDLLGITPMGVPLPAPNPRLDRINEKSMNYSTPKKISPFWEVPRRCNIGLRSMVDLPSPTDMRINLVIEFGWRMP